MQTTNSNNKTEINLIRYTHFPMPVYAFVPGINQHPDKKTEYKHLPDIPDKIKQINKANWQNSSHYLYAIDLFNQAYYWEVHEVLENLWIKAGKNTESAIFLKGIIQLSVALLKFKINNLQGTQRLFNKALMNLHRPEAIYLGINIEKLITDFQKYISKESKKPPLIQTS